jgi:uncharacterized protein with PQ loop repeat
MTNISLFTFKVCHTSRIFFLIYQDVRWMIVNIHFMVFSAVSMTTIYVKPNDDGLIKLIALLEMGK